MLYKIREKFFRRKRRRRLRHFRRESAGCGYPLDEIKDEKLEAALTRGGQSENLPLSAKTIYLALRRLSAERTGGNGLRARGINERRESPKAAL